MERTHLTATTELGRISISSEAIAQLVVNILGMALAGWATLALQRELWSRNGLVRRFRRRAVDDPHG